MGFVNFQALTPFLIPAGDGWYVLRMRILQAVPLLMLR